MSNTPDENTEDIDIVSDEEAELEASEPSTENPYLDAEFDGVQDDLEDDDA